MSTKKKKKIDQKPKKKKKKKRSKKKVTVDLATMQTASFEICVTSGSYLITFRILAIGNTVSRISTLASTLSRPVRFNHAWYTCNFSLYAYTINSN